MYGKKKKNPIFDRRLNIGEKGDPVQAEPDLFCYERFEDWASKLRKRNVSDCQLEKKEEWLFSTTTTTTAAAAAEEEEEEGQEQQQQQQEA